MWNLLKGIGISFGLDNDEELSANEEKEFLDALTSNEDRESYFLREFHQCNSVEEIGKITHVSGDTAVIDNEYYFNIDYSSCSQLSINDSVKFTVFYNDVSTIIKNVQKLEISDKDGSANSSLHELREVDIENNKYSLSGQVVSRSRRLFEVKLDSVANVLKINLDYSKTEFIPTEGDFIDLCASQTVSENKNEEIQVFKIKPSKTALKSGVITSWNLDRGTISNFAFFTLISCVANFEPRIGQRVFASLIRSDSQNGYKWRAIQVIPQNSSHSDLSLQEYNKKIEYEFRNKRGISVSIPPKVMLKLNSQKNIVVDVTNNSSSDKVMSVHCVSCTEQEQVLLMYPASSNIVIKPDETINFPFRIQGKFVGSSFGEFTWDFGDFSIRRKISFEVICDSLPDSKDGMLLKTCCSKHISGKNILEKSKGEIMPGRRHTYNSVFIPVKIGQFLVPKNLILAAVPEKRVNFNDLRISIENVVPCLKEILSYSNYQQYFHNLIFLEEIEFLRKVAKMDIEGASFRKHLDYLILDVPEYSAYTKHFMPGDFVLISLPWDKDKKMQGIIHRITKTELWLKFAQHFHTTYIQGSSYFISFVASRTSLRRMHQAVDIAMKHLGKHWLFPTSVYPRVFQVTFDEIDETLAEVMKISQHINQIKNDARNSPLSNPFTERPKFKSSKRGKGGMWNRSGAGCGSYFNENEYSNPIEPRKFQKIKWYNSMLNKCQKHAVIRILLAEARPLPYVIFGPPGTGKTVTVVEAILQLHHLLPESRILVATPTNSAADLIAERLLDSGNLQEGDFLRLVGLNYLEQGRLTASLTPYTATPSFRDLNDDDASFDVQTFNRQEISEFRIIVGTIGCLGVLYNMGFPHGFFTHIFIDEAGQTTEPELMVLMAFLSLQNGSVILSGDPLQLGPVVTSQLAAAYGLSESFIVRLLNRFPYMKDPLGFPENFGYDPRLVTKLTDNYRSMYGILQLFNTIFYNNDLVAKVSSENSGEAILLQSIKSIKLNFPVLMHGLQGSCIQEPNSTSWHNPQEVFQVFTYLNKLYLSGLKPDHIGIITPYQMQARKIQALLEFYNLESPKIGSVEEFQGQEKMVILLSLVKKVEVGDGEDLIDSDFVTDPKRMNVAISRARALLIIIGDPELMSRDCNWLKVLRYCVKNSCYIGCEIPPSINLL